MKESYAFYRKFKGVVPAVLLRESLYLCVYKIVCLYKIYNQF